MFVKSVLIGFNKHHLYLLHSYFVFLLITPIPPPPQQKNNHLRNDTIYTPNNMKTGKIIIYIIYDTPPLPIIDDPNVKFGSAIKMLNIPLL